MDILTDFTHIVLPIVRITRKTVGTVDRYDQQDTLFDMLASLASQMI